MSEARHLHDHPEIPPATPLLKPVPSDDSLDWVELQDPEVVDADNAEHEWLDEMADSGFFEELPTFFDRWPTLDEMTPQELNDWLWTEYGRGDDER